MSEDTKKGNLKRLLKDADPAERKALVDALPYKVGFGKPPESTRFKPGDSGNKKGRPRTPLDIQDLVRKEIAKKIVITDRERRERLSKIQVSVRQLVNQAATGDAKALMTLIQLMGKTGQLGSPETAPTNAPPIDQRDVEALSALLPLFTSGSSEPDDSGAGGASK